MGDYVRFRTGATATVHVVPGWFHTCGGGGVRRSVPLGALSALGARGAAGVLVVGVDAEPGLDHHHAVVMLVPAVFIWKEKKR